MRVEHDHDDPPPMETWVDGYWFLANRMAELGMRLARLWGFL